LAQLGAAICTDPDGAGGSSTLDDIALVQGGDGAGWGADHRQRKSIGDVYIPQTRILNHEF
jgi:hypothetical protein